MKIYYYTKNVEKEVALKYTKVHKYIRFLREQTINQIIFFNNF